MNIYNLCIHEKILKTSLLMVKGFISLYTVQKYQYQEIREFLTALFHTSYDQNVDIN